MPHQNQPRPAPRPQVPSNLSFFPMAVAPVSVSELSENRNQQRYDCLHRELQELKQKLEPYAQQREISEILQKIERLLSQKVNSTYECRILHCIMDESAYIHIKGQKHFLAEKEALEKQVQLNKKDLSGNDLSDPDNVPIEINIPVRSMINEWLDNFGKDVAKLQEASENILLSLPESNTQTFPMGMRRR